MPSSISPYCNRGYRCTKCDLVWEHQRTHCGRLRREGHTLHMTGPRYHLKEWSTDQWEYITCVKCLAQITQSFIQDNKHKGLLWFLANIEEYPFWEYRESVDVMFQRIIGFTFQEGLEWHFIRNPYNTFNHTAALLSRGNRDHVYIARAMTEEITREIKYMKRTMENTEHELHILDNILDKTKTALQPYVEKPLACRLRSNKKHTFNVSL